MNRRTLWISSAMICGSLVLGACGQSKEEMAEIETCEKVARAALHNPATFKVAATKVDETSEGVEILVEIDYSGREGSGHVSDKCWFAGYGKQKPLTRFSSRSDPAGDYVELPEEELQEYLQQAQS